MNANHGPGHESLPAHYTVGLGEILAIIWRRKLYVLLCLVAATGLGSVYLLRAEPTYEVKARLLVERQDLPLAVPNREKPAKDLEFLATQAEILKSPAVVGQAAQQINWPVPAESVSPADDMLSSLTVRPVMGTNVLSVGFQASAPDRAVTAVMAIIDSYQRYLSDNERDNHSETLELLTRNEKELRKDLQSLESQYAELRKSSPLGGKGKGGVDVHMALVEELGRQLAEARHKKIQLENQLQIVDRGSKVVEDIAEVSTSGRGYFGYAITAPTPRAAGAPPLTLEGEHKQLPLEGPTAPELATIHEQLLEAQMREQGLAARFGHKHPELRAVREQIARLLLEQQAAIDSAPGILRTQLEAADANETRLAQMYQAELDTAKSIDLFLLEESQMLGQITRVRTLHDSIVDQVREWKLTDEVVAHGRSRVKVTLLEQPAVPRKPVWPEPFLLYGVCAVIGLFSAAALITYVECRSPSYPPRQNEAVVSGPGLLVPSIDNA